MLPVLLSPLSYLRIKHEAKWLSDWLYPSVLTVLSVASIFILGEKGAIGGKDGLIDRLQLVSSVLPGFYIAALAAIATFNRPDIDEFMPEPTPRISVAIGGHDNVIRLTRRRFLSHLFAFLCWESLVLLIVCVFSETIGHGVVAVLPLRTAHLATIAFTAILLSIFWQLVCTTCLGLYYLGDRLHHPTY